MDLTHTRETTIKSIEGYKVSDRGDKILVWRNARPIYRRSFDAEYYVYEVRTRILRPLSTDHSRQRAPLFSPMAAWWLLWAPTIISISRSSTTGLSWQ